MNTTAQTTFTPTDEQQQALDLFGTGIDLVIEAGAGTGKTSTLKLLAESTDRRGVYVAFNRAIVEEAKRKMPRNVTASTAHSLAFKAVGSKMSHRLNGRRMKSAEIAKLLGLDPIVLSMSDGSTKRLAPGYLGGLVQRAVVQFCQTADTEIAGRHVPRVEGIDTVDAEGVRQWANNRVVQQALLPALRRAWADLQDPNGQLPYRHDHYLKAWQLQGPMIAADFIMFDEAQDANPVMRAIVDAQEHAQRVWVGDSQQQIYGFTGAVNALARVTGNRTWLTRSFRFGPEIAGAANEVLAQLDTEMRIEGAGQPGELTTLASPDVLLTRTNATAVRAALDEMISGGRPAIVGGAAEVVRFAQAATELKRKGWTSHPELACFQSWGEVQDYVDTDPNGSELSLMVRLVDDFGADVIAENLAACVPEDRATLVISTAHKAKGLEWDAVKLGDDFPTGFSKNGEEVDVAPEELRLLYVAATRARRYLDTSGNPIIAKSSTTEPDENPAEGSGSPADSEPDATTADSLLGASSARIRVPGDSCEFGCAHTGVVQSATVFGRPGDSQRIRLMVEGDSGRVDMAIVAASSTIELL